MPPSANLRKTEKNEKIINILFNDKKKKLGVKRPQ
jgi:hypothetical protein